MSAGHMPEPWLVDSDNCHAGQIATLHGDDEGYAEIWSMHWPYNPHNSQFANARRIVSCVNALEGLNQDDLDSGWNFKNADARLTAEEIKNDRLKALNAELAAALEMLMYVHPIPSTQCSERPAYEKACAALTKHTKE